MLKNRAKAVVFVGLLCGPAITASASRLGHPGVSTRGATGPQTRWNLISDPPEVLDGSDTTIYPKNATISEVDPVFPYQLTAVTVELSDGDGGLFYNTYFPQEAGTGTATKGGGIVLINPETFDGGTETGRVQVSWNIISGAKPPAPTVDDNTDILRFSQAPGTTNRVAKFTDTMVDFGNSSGAPAPDFYSGIGLDGKPFTYSADPNSPYFVRNFTTETVSLYLGSPAANPPSLLSDAQTRSVNVAVPEPSSIGLAGILSAVALIRRRRRGGV